MGLSLNKFLSAFLVVSLLISVNGYTQSAPPVKEPAKEMLSLTEMVPWLLPVHDYSGDLSNREAFFGDFDGARNDLLAKGLSIDVAVTQVLQNNTAGGLDTNNGLQYAGSADYYLNLDTAKMGLWPGGLIKLHGETQFGRSVNPKVGSFMVPNSDALFPVPEDPGKTTLSELYIVQTLSEKLMLLLGKIDGSQYADNNKYADNYRTKFLNTALFANPLLFPYAPYTVLSAILMYMPKGNEDIVLILAVLDSHGTATRSGFDTVFSTPTGTAVTGELDLKLNPFDQPGNYRFGFIFSNKEFPNFAQDPRQRVADLVRGLPPDRVSDSFAVYFNFDQTFFSEPEDSEQGWGLFGRAGWADEDENIFSLFFSAGIGGQGIIEGRDNDTFGIGWYYLDITDQLHFLGVDNEQGVEIYYNVEVTPWLHVTPDVQVIIDPAGGLTGRDDSLVIGVRAQMEF